MQQAAQQSGSGKPSQRSLAVLLHDLSDCLVAASDDSATSQSESEGVASRMRTVLMALFDLCVNVHTVKEKELQTVLKLVNLALAKFPTMFSGGHCSSALSVFSQILPMLGQERLRAMHSPLADTAATLVSLVATSSRATYAALFQGTLDLVQDLHQVLKVMALPGALPKGAVITVDCFQGTSLRSGSEGPAASHDTHQGPANGPANGPGPHAQAQAPMGSSRDQADPAQQPHAGAAGMPDADKAACMCTVQLTTMPQCQLLLAAALGLLAHCLNSTPLELAPLVSQDTANRVHDLLAHGGFTVQTAALPPALALHAQCPVPVTPVETLLSSVTYALETWAHTGDCKHGLFPIWQDGMLACLHVLGDIGVKLVKLPPAFQDFAQALSIAAASAPPGSYFQGELCKLFVGLLSSHAAALLPHIVHWLPLLSVRSADTREAMAAALRVLASLTMDGDLDLAVATATGEPAAEAALQDQEARDMPLPKRRRVGSSTQQASQEPPQQSQIAALFKASTAAPPASLTPGPHSTLVGAFVGAVPSLGPGSEGRWSADERMAALTVLLSGLGRAGSGKFMQLAAPVVSEWLVWAFSEAQRAEDAGIPASQLTLVLGMLDAYYAACAHNTDPHQLLYPAACRAAKLLTPTVDQLTALIQHPWTASRSQSLSQPSAKPASQGGQAGSLIGAKLCAIRVHLALVTYFPDSSKALLANSQHSKPLGAFAAIADPDAGVRAAGVTVLAALQALCPSQASELSQRMLPQLQSLAADTDARVRHAVAASIGTFTNDPWQAGEKVGGLAAACTATQRVQLLGAVGHHWAHVAGQPGSGLTSARASSKATGFGLEALTEFCRMLLFQEADSGVQVAMLTSSVRCLNALHLDVITGCEPLLLQLLAVASRPDQDLRDQLAASARVLADPELLQVAFSKQAGKSDSSALCSAEFRLLQELQQLLENEVRGGVKESLLHTIAAAGAHMQGPSAQLLLLVVLIGRLADPDPCLRATAVELLHSVAEARQSELQDLVFGLPKLLEYVGRNLVAKPELLGELADLLELSLKELALKILPSALPRLIEAQDRPALQVLAASIDMQMPTMLKEYGYYVVAKYLYEGNDSFGAFMVFMEEVTGENFVVYMNAIMQRIMMEIISQAGAAAEWSGGVQLPQTVYDRAERMLHELSLIQGPESVAVADFLADCDHVTRILKDCGDVQQKQQTAMQRSGRSELAPAEVASRLGIIRQLMLILRLTGPYVGRFVPQLMVLLTSAVRQNNPQNVKLQALEGWLNLVQALAKQSPAQLGGLVNQVVVALLESLQEGGPVTAAAAKVIEELILQTRQLLKGRLRGLPPLPQSVPALTHVNKMIAEQRGSLTADEQIRSLLESLSSHSLSVRSTALQELRDYMHMHRSWLGGLLAGSSAAASQDGGGDEVALLSSLMAALLKCCDPEVHTPISMRAQQLCAECLGLLGAVDPARLSVELDLPESLCRADRDLPVTLITKHLVRLLRVAPDLQTLDAATFAIQELLRHYSGSDPAEPPGRPATRPGSREGTPMESNALFLALPPDVQAVVRPYLDSKYQLRTGTSSQPKVVFRSGTSFRRWLSAWLKQLVDHHASGPCLKLFQACLPVFGRDIQTCMFLLPYLAQNVVSFGSGAARQGVKDEIEAVLRGGHAHKEGELCLQAIFSLLDVLKKWLEDNKNLAAPASSVATTATGSRSSGAISDSLDTEGRRVQELLSGIPQNLLAQAAFQCGAHARALQYYETYVRAQRNGGLNPAAFSSAQYSDEEVSFLQEVYGKLEEPDGLSGLVRLRSGGPRLSDQILAAEKAGYWNEALSLYEQALHDEPALTGQGPIQSSVAMEGQPLQGLVDGLKPAQRGHLRCKLQMGQLQGMLAQVDGWASRCSDAAKRQLAACGTAAAWRLGQWELLEEYLGITGEASEGLDSEEKWEVRIGKLLSATHRRDSSALSKDLEAARNAIMAPLSAASMESYSRAYPYLVKLHMLQELRDASTLLQEEPALGPLERQRRLKWDERLKITQSSLITQEPILALRRQLAVLSGADSEAGGCWLQHAKLCRISGHHEAATTATLEAIRRGVVGAPVERAKLLWKTDQPLRAIGELQGIIKQMESKGGAGTAGPSVQLTAERKRGEAKVVLQLARWMAETGQGSKADITGLFERAVALQSKWEKGYFCFATYLDQLMCDAKQRQVGRKTKGKLEKDMDRLGGRSRIRLGEDTPYLEILPEVLKHYGSSIQHGHRHIFQSLPRLLTLWFDFGSEVSHSVGRGVTQKERNIRLQVTNVISSLGKALPHYAWLAVLPQLISRICHQNAEVVELTKHIITRVTQSYPQQALWALAAVSKSALRTRMDAANSIISSAKKHAGEANKRLYAQFAGVCDQLIKLCNHQPPPKAVVFSAKGDFKVLVRMMPTDIIMPVNSLLTLTLPASGCIERDHQPFSHVVTIAGIKDEVEVLKSLQKPKKIVLIGSDGKEYAFLAKPKDDLRKDNRMMEFAGVLNRLFAKEPASRRRNLYLRRFAVVPLTEDCGLVEWVPKTAGLRHCCQDAYVADGLFDKRNSNGIIKKMYDKYDMEHPKASEPNRKKAPLLNSVLYMFPPRMHKWFLAKFPEPATWHNARLAFMRTTAVWSMVGHITGLGDRHGENILLDAGSGDAVHVDFSCLFDKGLTLAEPEMVPFRLTQNLIDGFGVSGYEGVYRHVCEITLQVLRSHRETLVSVLETFVHDPLVEWTRSHRQAEEVDNPQAKDAMATIEGRLNGTLLGVSSTPSLPLSAEGQAHRLIEEAVDKENLSQMYVWWMPWF